MRRRLRGRARKKGEAKLWRGWAGCKTPCCIGTGLGIKHGGRRWVELTGCVKARVVFGLTWCRPASVSRMKHGLSCWWQKGPYKKKNQRLSCRRCRAGFLFWCLIGCRCEYIFASRGAGKQKAASGVRRFWACAEKRCVGSSASERALKYSAFRT